MFILLLFYMREAGLFVSLQARTNNEHIMKTKSILLVIAMGLVQPIMAQQDVSLDGEWKLTVDGKSYQVMVPHTYNIMDGLEDYAGEAVYQRTLPITNDMKGQSVMTAPASSSTKPVVMVSE